MKNGETKTFEAQLTKLEKIVRDMERGDLPLEKSLELFEQGVRLSRECQERLNEAERRIELLLRDDESGRTFTTPFEDNGKLDPSAAGDNSEEDESVF
ncbi:MAG: exodeoxyribonuclease VII small subunit [Pyrinomonadaceae bacterium]|nr:exodeoxyribonuclease VII small subunit [Pyrinomonadaceae bacterium]